MASFASYERVLAHVMSVLQDELDIFGGPDTDLQTGEIELDSFDKTNILLAAEALGLGACAVGAFYDSAVSEFLGLDGEGEVAVYMVAVGRQAPEQPGRGA